MNLASKVHRVDCNYWILQKEQMPSVEQSNEQDFVVVNCL